MSVHHILPVGLPSDHSLTSTVRWRELADAESFERLEQLLDAEQSHARPRTWCQRSAGGNLVSQRDGRGTWNVGSMIVARHQIPGERQRVAVHVQPLERDEHARRDR